MASENEGKSGLNIINKWRAAGLLFFFVIFLVLVVYNSYSNNGEGQEVEEETIEEQSNEANSNYISQVEEVENEATESSNENEELSEEDRQSQEVAEQFVRVIYPYEGDKPNENFEEAKKFVTETFKQIIETDNLDTFRPTPDYFNRELIDIEIKALDYPTEDFVSWNVIVEGEYYNSEGEKTENDFTTYLVRLDKEEGDFKVADFITNFE